MLTKFESKSNRVKGLAFHISRPWILTALHNGVIQLWDYRMGTLLDRFDEHEGPVRGVAFHQSQPIFVSGGDDYKLKVWDYKLRRCLFTLLGHLDYIRTVQFHHEYPWIISCSDDQTVRIWNWQSRSCLSVLTGHNHYVMCAQFHPKDDMVVSASLDQTVRVWDTTGLRKKTVRGAPPTPEEQVSARGSDLFGGNDAVVKYVLEGHERGVNWASFHPTLPLIVSGADDRQVKLWRMNETKAWEVDTMRGHTNNVSCVLFHPRHELIISNSEDRSIRVWDISKRLGVQTFRRENDRFWVLEAHPKQNLLAAGHDSGMIVFKLERERPALGYHGDNLFYVKERYLRMHNFSNGKDVPVVSLRLSGTIGTGLSNSPRSLQYNVFNPAENNFLLCSDGEGGTYELLSCAKDGNGTSESQDSRKGSGLSAVFVARNRFAVLDKSHQIVIKNFQNEVTKKIIPPTGSADAMFFGGIAGRLILRCEDKVILYENQSLRVLAEIQAPRIKYVVWSDDFNHVALISKHLIMITNRHLEHETTITETVRIKGGVWEKTQGIFVYTTLNHIKYCLPTGDMGIIRTLDIPIYLTHLDDSTLHCLDREGKTRTILLDMTECNFKIALNKKRYSEVMRMIKHSRLCGQAIISYLTTKGYPEVALHFVKDEKTRFNLAVSCGNLEVALNCAYELDDERCWQQLALEALNQGNQQVVEMAYQRTKDFERLSFLYFITGNREKLEKMLKIAEMRNDVMGRFRNALYLGDVKERVAILESVGQLGLALIAANAHGLSEDAERIRQSMEQTQCPIPSYDFDPAIMLPPVPIIAADSSNWPLVQIKEKTLEDAAKEAYENPIDENPIEVKDENETGGAWDDDLEFDKPSTKTRLSVDFGGEAGAEWDEDIDLGDDDLGIHHEQDVFANADTDKFVAAPSPGMRPSLQWVTNSSVAADHVAAGSFETAMQLLHRQIGVINFSPLKHHFMAIYTGASCSLPTLASVSSVTSCLQRSGAGTKKTLPLSVLGLSQLAEELKTGYRAFTAAKFDELKISFDHIIHSIPLLVVDSREEVSQAKELLGICREYILAFYIRGEISSIPLESDPKRNVELCAYFTHCNLQPSHLLLALKSALQTAYKTKNFIIAASFCRRLLELPEIASEKHANTRTMAKKVLQRSEVEARNENQVDYSDSTPFSLCCKSLTPIYRGDASVKCPYCASSYRPAYKGQLCVICGLSQIGEETLGLVVSTGEH